MREPHEIIEDLVRAHMDPADTRYGVLTFEEEVHLIFVAVMQENYRLGRGRRVTTAQFVAKVTELLPETRKGAALEHAEAAAEQISI